MDEGDLAVVAHMETLFYSINVSLIMIYTARRPRFQFF